MTKKHQSQVGILIYQTWAFDSATIFPQSVNKRVLPPYPYPHPTQCVCLFVSQLVCKSFDINGATSFSVSKMYESPSYPYQGAECSLRQEIHRNLEFSWWLQLTSPYTLFIDPPLNLPIKLIYFYELAKLLNEIKNFSSIILLSLMNIKMSANMSIKPFHCQSKWWSCTLHGSNFSVCRWNPVVWPFKWNLFDFHIVLLRPSNLLIM